MTGSTRPFNWASAERRQQTFCGRVWPM